jgi:methylenetetrahydrofolate dehydrogenase (NADP+)/methenyltetrahydrofolate cyclohydrolase
MAAGIVDGHAVARDVYAGLAPRIARLAAQGVRPGLAAVRVGDNPASKVYVARKARACADAGIHSEVHHLSGDCTPDALLHTIAGLNANPRIHGIIVQLPLPRPLDSVPVLQSIAPEKDVDGFGWRNLGALVDGHPQFVPGTPLGIMALLDHVGIEVEGANAVVVGRSTIVGKPTALLLIGRGATVTVCHSRTRDLGLMTSLADILVVAAGKPGLIRDGMVKPGATIIDVGINRLPDGRLVGDVDFARVQQAAAWITPVPGGVGPMTVAMLIANTVTAAERAGQLST